MNKSELFKAAHKLAKSVIKAGDNYRVTFGAAIKAVKEGFVAVEKITVVLKAWNKKEGELRVYLNLEDSNDDLGYVLIEGKKLNYSKVEFAYVERIKAAVATKLAKLQAKNPKYSEKSVMDFAALSI